MQMTHSFSTAFIILKNTQPHNHPKAVLSFVQVWVQSDSSTESVATLGDAYPHDNSTTSTTSCQTELQCVQSHGTPMSFKDLWELHSVFKTHSDNTMWSRSSAETVLLWIFGHWGIQTTNVSGAAAQLISTVVNKSFLSTRHLFQVPWNVFCVIITCTRTTQITKEFCSVVWFGQEIKGGWTLE